MLMEQKYVGGFLFGEYSGHGTHTYSDRAKYEGEFKDGQPEGQGIFAKPDGTKYVGGIQGWKILWSRNTYLS